MDKTHQKFETVTGTGCLPVRGRDGNKIYDIWLEDSFDALPKALAPLDLADRRVCIVTDSNVAPLYAESVRALTAACCRQTEVYVFPAGEEHKTLDEIRKLYAFLIEKGFDRGDVLAALGGGVTGDMTGYAAATYLRGIRFIQIPTTLLAQVDSSIGGKTGVDFDSYKNMVGAFHQPSLVYMNLRTTDTLPEEQFACGMGEILKHGLIRDEAYYEWLGENAEKILARDPEVLLPMVRRSCEIKRAVVEEDPTEKGLRAILNFGHTLGHAAEKVMDLKLLHGQCVALGSVAAARLSERRGLVPEGTCGRVKEMNRRFGLPEVLPDVSPEQIVEAAAHDKKMDAGQIKFVLLRAVGDAYVDPTVTREEMLDAASCMCGTKSRAENKSRTEVVAP